MKSFYRRYKNNHIEVIPYGRFLCIWSPHKYRLTIRLSSREDWIIAIQALKIRAELRSTMYDD